MMKFKINITVNYPDDEAEAAIPDRPMSLVEVLNTLKTLTTIERDLTSFVLIAVKVPS